MRDDLQDDSQADPGRVPSRAERVIVPAVSVTFGIYLILGISLCLAAKPDPTPPPASETAPEEGPPARGTPDGGSGTDRRGGQDPSKLTLSKADLAAIEDVVVKVLSPGSGATTGTNRKIDEILEKLSALEGTATTLKSIDGQTKSIDGQAKSIDQKTDKNRLDLTSNLTSLAESVQRLEKLISEANSWEATPSDVMVIACESGDLQYASYREAYKAAVYDNPARSWFKNHQIGLYAVRGQSVDPILPLGTPSRQLEQNWNDVGSKFKSEPEQSADLADLGPAVVKKIEPERRRFTRIVLVAPTEARAPDAKPWGDLNVDVVLVSSKHDTPMTSVAGWAAFCSGRGVLSVLSPPPPPGGGPPAGPGGGKPNDWNGFSLQIPKLNDAGGLPANGKNLVVVASVKNLLHLRIFDGKGGRIADTDEAKLQKQATQLDALKKQLDALRKQLEPLWTRAAKDEKDQPKKDEKDQVIAAVASIIALTSTKKDEVGQPAPQPAPAAESGPPATFVNRLGRELRRLSQPAPAK